MGMNKDNYFYLSFRSKERFIFILLFLNTMGTNISITDLEVSQPLSSQWAKHSRESYCAVIKNIETGQQAEQYVVLSNSHISIEFQKYDYRLHQNQNLVSTWAVQSLTNDGVCGNSHKLLVTNQRIPIRLSEVSGFNFQDSLAIVYASFIGFQAIHEIQGYVAVTDEMIGFTSDNRIKVWLNENFSVNDPVIPNRMVSKELSAGTMVKQILSNVEIHSAEPEFIEFKNYFLGRFSTQCSFATALAIIRQYFQFKQISVLNRVTFAGGIIREIETGQYRTRYVYHQNTQNLQLNGPQIRKSTVIQTGQPVVSSFLHEQPVGSFPINTISVVAPPPISTNSVIANRNTATFTSNLNGPIAGRKRSISGTGQRIASPLIQPITQITSASHIADNINIQPVSLLPRNVNLQKNTNINHRVQSINKQSILPFSLINSNTTISPVQLRSVSPIKNQSQRQIQTNGSVTINNGINHKIGQTLHKYENKTIQGSNKLITTPPASNIPIANINRVISQQSAQINTPSYVHPKVHIHEKRIINIDGVTPNKIEQSEAIVNNHQPKSPISNLPEVFPQNVVAEPLQKANKETDKNVSANTVQKKQQDLIEYMKVNLDGNIGFENKNMIHSFGEKNDYEINSENLLSSDVRNLLKNYENRGKYQEQEASGYALESKYKTTQKIQAPIIIFNDNDYDTIRTKKFDAVDKYEYKNDYKYSSYQSPSDDYEALKAKYATNYERKKESTYDDYDFTKKYGDYKFNNQNSYDISHKTQHNLGQSKYLKDYAPNQNLDNPLIVFNTRKTDIGARNSLGYKTAIQDGYENNYDQYRSYLRKDNDAYADNKYSKTNYQNKHRFQNYGRNDYDKVYEGQFDADKYDRGYKQDRNNKYSSRKDTKYPREAKKRTQKYEGYQKQDRRNKYSTYDDYGDRQNQYSNRRQQRRDVRKEYHEDKNISYHDLKSLLYD